MYIYHTDIIIDYVDRYLRPPHAVQAQEAGRQAVKVPRLLPREGGGWLPGGAGDSRSLSAPGDRNRSSAPETFET